MEQTSPEDSTSRERASAPDRWRPRLLSVRPSLASADLLLLAALVILTAALGPTFSLLAVDGRVLQITEVVMLGILLLALRRLGLRTAAGLARRRLPLVALGVLWVSAAVALARGLSDFDPSQLVYDVRLLEYSVLLVIVVLVVDSRERLGAMVDALVLGALAGTVLFGLSALSARAFDTTAWLSDGEGEIAMAGLYAGIYLIWLLARVGVGQRPSKLELLAGGMGALLIGLTSKRAIWLAMLITLPAVAVAAERSRRVRLALAGAAVVVAGVGAAIAIETVLGEPVPKSAEAAARGGRTVTVTEAARPGPRSPASRAGTPPRARTSAGGSPTGRSSSRARPSSRSSASASAPPSSAGRDRSTTSAPAATSTPMT